MDVYSLKFGNSSDLPPIDGKSECESGKLVIYTNSKFHWIPRIYIQKNLDHRVYLFVSNKANFVTGIFLGMAWLGYGGYGMPPCNQWMDDLGRVRLRVRLRTFETIKSSLQVLQLEILFHDLLLVLVMLLSVGLCMAVGYAWLCMAMHGYAVMRGNCNPSVFWSNSKSK